MDEPMKNGQELSMEESSVAEKRKKIQEIMADESIDQKTRNHRIQALMDGSSSQGEILRRATTDFTEDVMTCVHYKRNCNIVAPCCGRIFGCRVCHDELTLGCGPMDRFKVREVVCKICNTRQERSNKCIECNTVFAEYHCNICNLWMGEDKKPFHCEKCGFCRVGGAENYTHCDNCCMCLDNRVYDNHNCLADKYKNNCPVCREDMHTSRHSPQDLPCGHVIHSVCFRKLAAFDYRCPICKKTVISPDSMAAAWTERAHDIESQPMPPDLAREVNILCNDCETKSDKRNWHFLGVQCPSCNSFNTVITSDSDQPSNMST